MENLTKMLEKLYSSQNGMLYFYIVTGSIALLLIILIIVSISKGKKKEVNVDSTHKIEEKQFDKAKEVKEVQEVKEDNLVSENIDIKSNELDNSDVILSSTDDVSLDNKVIEDVPLDEDKDLDLSLNEEVKEDSLDMLFDKLDKHIDLDNNSEDDIELPKTKEDTLISNDDFIERLNALKNK